MMTTGEIAKLFQITSQTVINWLEEGRMPFDRVGRGPRRVTEAALLNYIQQTGLSADSFEPELYAKLLKSVGITRDVKQRVPAVAVLDKHAKIVSWNEGMVKLFGMLSYEMVGRPIDSLPTQIDGANTGVEFQISSAWQGNMLKLRARCKNRGGQQEIPCTISVSRIYAGDGADRAGYVLVYGAE